MHFELTSGLWVDLVGLAVLFGTLLLAGLYVVWCSCLKSLRDAHGTAQAGMFRLAAARGELKTLACLHAAGMDVDADHNGFTALHAAAVMGQLGECVQHIYNASVFVCKSTATIIQHRRRAS